MEAIHSAEQTNSGNYLIMYESWLFSYFLSKQLRKIDHDHYGMKKHS